MNNLISPYDLGASQIVEDTQRVSINVLVKKAIKDLKKRIVEAQIETLGMNIKLTSSRTRFNGERLWFVCPVCTRKTGMLYKSSGGIGCRKCLRLVYKKQRYKGMVENN